MRLVLSLLAPTPILYWSGELIFLKSILTNHKHLDYIK